jgi:hypothetical protein
VGETHDHFEGDACSPNHCPHLESRSDIPLSSTIPTHNMHTTASDHTTKTKTCYTGWKNSDGVLNRSGNHLKEKRRRITPYA